MPTKRKSGKPEMSRHVEIKQEFDALLARMQTSKARRGMKAAFAASGKRLGKAAVAATRSRG
jgi:hypothetical protein